MGNVQKNVQGIYEELLEKWYEIMYNLINLGLIAKKLEKP